ncbi:MAG: hypothetical protein AAFX99_12710, partial [Myxococcota bacterium]
MSLNHRQRAAARRLTASVLLPRLMEQLKGEPLHDEDDPALLADLLHLLELDPDWKALGRALLEAPTGQGRTSQFAALWLSVLERLPPRGAHHLALLQVHWGWRALAEVTHTGPTPVQRRWSQAMKYMAQVLESDAFFLELSQACGAGPDEARTLQDEAAQLWLQHLGHVLHGLTPAPLYG